MEHNCSCWSARSETVSSWVWAFDVFEVYKVHFISDWTRISLLIKVEWVVVVPHFRFRQWVRDGKHSPAPCFWARNPAGKRGHSHHPAESGHPVVPCCTRKQSERRQIIVVYWKNFTKGSRFNSWNLLPFCASSRFSSLTKIYLEFLLNFCYSTSRGK